MSRSHPLDRASASRAPLRARNSIEWADSDSHWGARTSQGTAASVSFEFSDRTGFFSGLIARNRLTSYPVAIPSSATSLLSPRLRDEPAALPPRPASRVRQNRGGFRPPPRLGYPPARATRGTDEPQLRWRRPPPDKEIYSFMNPCALTNMNWRASNFATPTPRAITASAHNVFSRNRARMRVTVVLRDPLTPPRSIATRLNWDSFISLVRDFTRTAPISRVWISY